MLRSYTLNSIAIIIALNFFIVAGLFANLKKDEYKTSFKKHEVYNQSETINSKKDSLPEGVTREWLNSLRDENGSRIITESNSSHEIPEDPEGDAMQRKTFSGFNAGDLFGNSISSAGDVNGDGFDDVIIGARGYSSGRGRAYIYFGGLIMNTVADVMMTGVVAGGRFGISVSGAGDVNGDGYDDVVVGADMANQAYVFFGGASMNGIADVTMSGEGGTFGFCVSKAGDVNGDGYSDVFIGARLYSSNTGRAYIFYGGSTMNNTADVTMTGEASGDQLGFSVSDAGDVNGDGYSDVIAGAFGNSTGTGKAYIYFGGASMNNAADVTMTGEATGNEFGLSVSKAGDVNGDGYSDVIVGAWANSSAAGRAYIYLGGTSPDNAADIILSGEFPGNYFGEYVSSAGDVNGDGFSDVIVSAYGYSSNLGRAYVFFGGTSMNNSADIVITGETTTGIPFGIPAATAGDVNGDGYSDLIVSAYGFSSNTGKVYLYDYNMKNDITQELIMTGESSDNYFGYSVSGAGDVNGDGYSDVIVGAYGYSSFSGRAYIYFGGFVMDKIADVTMTGESSDITFGNSVSTAGDVNGDGYSDVIVAASKYSSFTGRAYIFFGGAAMNNSADVTMTGESASSDFGNSVSCAGDVNGDGYQDVIVGASRYSSSTGKAYIYFGGASMDNLSDVTMTGEGAGNYFGVSVSGKGDVNGDGYSDVIVGALGYASITGRAYIFYGGAAMNNAADVTMTGEGANNNFGYSVSGTGDVNGDGYSDVIVGAYQFSSFTGRAYIYFGGAVMNNVADVTMTGEATGNSFGVSVSSAGDVNGDGYSDVLVGAWGRGRAYVYFGGAAMNNVVDVTMTRESAGTNFGISVSRAGDINGDGYSDMIIGADAYSSNSGRAYIYYSSAISTKPVLNFVRDVPNDQGGYVNLKWARSSFDVIGNSTITSYSVYRSYPPVGGNFLWEEVASVTAVHQSFYTFTSPTPYDSGTNNTGNFFFKVRAKTYDINEFWESAILSGRSIDNISPPAVSVFTAASSGSGVITNWSRSIVPDLQDYILFRNVNPTIDPYTEPAFATTTDSTYIDTSPLTGMYYYFIVAQDVNGNYSPVSVAESPNITLNLTMFIQGFYNPESNEQTADTVTVELRNPVSPFAVIDRASSIVSENGTVQLKFGNASDGNYFISVKHRNSIETWNTAPVSFSRLSPVDFDLSSSSSQAFGINLIQIDISPVRFAVYSGDVNRDGAVDAADLASIDSDAFNFVTGYVNTDLTGDEVVDATDAAVCDNNAFNFVSAIMP